MTTNVIKKIGATNTPTVMDYSSLSTWAAACPANLVTVDQCWIGEVYNQGEISVSGVLLSATGDATRKAILRAATGQGFKDNAPAALRYNAANGAAIVITGGYDTLFGVTGSVAIEVQGLQLRSSVTNSGVLAFPSPSTTGVLVHECIISTVGNNHNGVNAVASFRGGIYSNNLFIHEGAGSGSQLLSISTNNTGLLVVNNTFVVTGTAGGTAIYSQYSGPAIYNNAFFGLIPPLDFGTTGTGTNNITDQASWGTNAPASPGTTGAAFTTANFNAVSGVSNGAGTGWDLRIPTGSALKDVGSTVNGTSIDILGTSRPQNTITDIGAFEFVVAAGNATVTPGAGSVVATGAVVTRSAGSTIAPAAGSVVATGATVTRSAGSTIAPSAGAVVGTGATVTRSAGSTAAPTAAAIVATGATVVRSAGSTVAPAAGSVILAGAAPSVTVSGNVTVAPGAASVALAGAQPVVNAGATIATSAGQVALAGATATRSAGSTLAPSAASVSASGAQPSINAGSTINPGAGAIAVQGSSPAVSAGGSISVSPGAGQIVVTGAVPTRIAGASIVVSAGAISLAGAQPVVTAGSAVIITPGAAQVAVAGTAPVLSRTAAVSPGQGHIILAGAQPSISSTSGGVTSRRLLLLHGQPLFLNGRPLII